MRNEKENLKINRVISVEHCFSECNESMINTTISPKYCTLYICKRCGTATCQSLDDWIGFWIRYQSSYYKKIRLGTDIAGERQLYQRVTQNRSGI